MDIGDWWNKWDGENDTVHGVIVKSSWASIFNLHPMYSNNWFAWFMLLSLFEQCVRKR